MKNILFCNNAYIKSRTTFDFNIDDNLIIPSIYDQQELVIKPLIGTSLYNEICNQISASTLSTANSTLLNEYIKPTLAAYVQYDCIDFLLYKFTNKSIEKQKSETSEPIGRNELELLKGKLLNKAETFAERTTQYLLANTSTYPLYLNQSTSSTDNLIPNANNYRSTIYTSGGRSNCWRNRGAIDLN